MNVSLLFANAIRLVGIGLFISACLPLRSQGQDTVAYYRFEEGDNADIINSVDGLVDGTTDAVFSTDVVGATISGQANEFSLDVGEASVAITEEPFVFHLDVCPTGNATVEFFFKAPTQSHASIFWTRPSLDGVDCERFSININDNPPGRVSGDYRKPDPQNCDGVSYANNSIIGVDEWHHFAKVRTELEDGSHLYEDYVDGVVHEVSTTVSAPDTEHVPTTTEWSIGGRAGFSLDPGTLIDEVRLSCAALTPEEFLSAGGAAVSCPRDGDELQDTHCTQLDVDPPTGSEAGFFTVFASGSDDSGDEVQYVFTADDGITTVAPVDQNGDIATFDLPGGFWTISVTVEDITPDSDLECDDAAVDNTCVIDFFEVLGGAPVSDAWYRFEEGDGELDLADSLSGAIHGRSFASGPPNMGVAMFSLDVPGNPVIAGAGGDEELNEFSMNLGTGFVVFDTLPFVFHSDAGCPNATVEFFFKAPDQEHGAIIWTQINDATDRDRFAININSGGRVSGDYKSGGVNYSTANNSIIPVNEWHHFAKVRTQQEDGSHLYEDYIDGELHDMSTTISPEDAVALPTGTTWLINGRGGAFNLDPGTLIDEVRLTCDALEPDEFLRVAKVVLLCPRDTDETQDTHCTVLDVDPPSGSPAGTFELTATAEDTSGDDVVYTFTATDGNEEETVGPQLENTASLRLSQGNWTISVSVEDITPDEDPNCDDAAPDKVCTVADFEVTERPSIAAYAYYRFEEGDGVEIEEEVTGDIHGESTALHSADVPETGPNGESWNPIPFTGQTNEFSMEIGAGIVTIDPISLDGLPFVFHQDVCPTGDATVEFFFKAPSQDHAAIFWTRPDDADSHRFGININPGGRVSGDYEGPDGRRHTIRNDGIIPVDEWHHFAKVRQELPDGSHVYSDYIDGVLWPTSTTVGPDLAANLPIEEVWRINGRGAGLDVGTLMDELRLSCEALLPGEFLIDSQEEPPPAPFPQTYYRFEDDLADSVSGDVHGTTDAGFSDDVPLVEVLGQPNTKSLSFSGGSAARFDGSTFVLHNGTEATLEWYMKPADQGHVGVFWTIDAPGDANRYNIHFQTPGLGADYREEGGDLHSVLDGNIVLPFDEWSHIAVVRTNAGDGGHQYDWYVNGEVMNTAIDATPLPPTATTWTISGRQGCCNAFNGLIDEVRMTPEALDPEDFLPAVDVRVIPPEDCGNGIDDDEDGDTDCADSDCEGNAACVEVCDDGEDNDGDGDVDCADADCEGGPACPSGVGPFIRGDCDGNGQVGGSPTEAIVLLNFAFRGGVAPGCLAACDAEANGSIGITDALRILRHAFLGMGNPDAPFPDCTKSDIASDVELGCQMPVACQ